MHGPTTLQERHKRPSEYPIALPGFLQSRQTTCKSAADVVPGNVGSKWRWTCTVHETSVVAMKYNLTRAEVLTGREARRNAPSPFGALSNWRKHRRLRNADELRQIFGMGSLLLHMPKLSSLFVS